MDSSKKYDNPSPEESANFLSKILFCWVLPFFKVGYKKNLEVKDLYNATKNNLSSTLGDLIEKNWEEELRRVKGTKNRPQLWRAIRKSFMKVYFTYGFYNFIQGVIIRIVHPLILAEYIKYFGDKTRYTYATAWILGAVVVFFSFLNALLMHNQSRGCQEVGMRCRVACCSLIYRKLLKLNRTSVGNTAGGQVINLMSNDVSRFDMACLFLHFMWLMPLQAIVAACVMYSSVEVAALVGLLAIAVQSIPLQGLLSKIQGKLRRKTAERTDYRVKLMSEITAGIQIIKMYAWEKPFAKIVEASRKAEIDIITKSSYIRGFLLALAVFTERTSLYVTVIVYVLLGYPLASDKVFSMAQFFNTIQLYMAIFFPLALVSYAEMKVSIKRIEDFLLKDERLALKSTDNKDECIKPGTISLDRIKASWIANPIICTLNDVSVDLKPGTLCCVIGPVGAGKSSLLQLLLKELPTLSGRLIVNGLVSYASQEPWLFVSSVRNNVLFGQPYDKNKYRDVVRACALEADFRQLLHGDRTLVGERGVSLSGGQKARINLARAVYRDTDIYLFDDPLSAVDTHVAKHLFEQCIKTYLNGKTRILVTHQVQFLKDADVIVVVNNGQIEATGTYNELENNYLSMFKNNSNNEATVDQVSTAGKSPMERNLSICSETSTNVDEEEEPQETQELMERGGVSKSVYKQYFLHGGNVFTLGLLAIFVVLAQVVCNASDVWLTNWTNDVERLQRESFIERTLESSNTTESVSITTLAPETTFDDNATTSSTLIPIKTATTVAYEGPAYTQNEYIYTYTVLVVVSVLLTTWRAMFFFKVCMKASKNLHNSMFGNVIQATMRFFDTNPSGRVLNRFSKDIGAVDEQLPTSMLDALQIFMVMLGILCMVFIVTPWMVGPAVVLAASYVLIRNVYLATAQDVKRLEGITRSPVFSHVTASLDGLTTIRANQVECMVVKEFDVLQDQHTAAWYLFIVTSRAFGFYLDVISTLFLAVVTFQFLIFDSDNALSGNVGLVISQSLILTGMVQHGIRQSAEVVSQMTSVERILQYTNLEKEGPFETLKKPPTGWPNRGEIQFDRASLKYAIDSPSILKNISFVIKPGQKVGVVGRTGAGKSSLISALFRLSYLEGSIKIDGVDTKDVGLFDLRSNISIIPQEPVLFTTSVRHNLDPFDKSNDEDLWKAIENVELKDAVENLDCMVQEGGSNFSAGQRQLICLARAIIRNNKILVMDEATANVDIQTDELIQKAIRKNFKNCTVITVAHRLKTIMDSDEIIVMDAGETVEIGSPHELLQKPSGYLSNMVSQVDKDTQGILRNIAKEAYEKTENVSSN